MSKRLSLVLVFPALIAGWTDTADQRRSTSLVHFMGLELMLEIRSEIGRRSAAIRPVASVRGAAEGRSEGAPPG